jgi:hypothetical protein
MARGNRFSVLSVNEAGCWENNEPMLAGKYQKNKKKKTRREKCEAGACKMCYALQLSGLECDHHCMCQGYSGMNHCQSYSTHRVQSQSV